MRRTGGRRAVDFDRHLENLRFKRRRCEEKKGGRKRREPHTGILYWNACSASSSADVRPRTLIRIVAIVVLSAITFGVVLQPIRTYGPSMLPTYRDGGLHLVNRLAYVRSEPRRGDVVAIRLAGRVCCSSNASSVCRVSVFASRLASFTSTRGRSMSPTSCIGQHG